MTVNYEIGKPRQDKRMRITLLLCIGKSKKRIKTDLFASATDLNRKGKLRNDSPIYKNVRARMFSLEKEYSALDTFLSGEELTAKEAYDRMRGTDIPTFFRYTEKWLEKADMKGKRNYITAINSFRAYLGHDTKFSALSHGILNDYMYSLKDRPRAQSMYMTLIKRIYSDAEKEYDLKPFSSFRIDIPHYRSKGQRALDAGTIRKVFLWRGKGKMANFARDCAILSFCLCGTNSADLYYAQPIRNNTLSYDRTKTKGRRLDNAHIEIRIPDQIKGLVRKYKGTSRAFLFHTLYSDEHSLNVSLNMGLKKIQKSLGLKGITFYSFRHSWASIARNELGIEKSLIHEALNHVERETMIDDIYIKKDFRLINEANQKVVDYIFNNP